MPDVPPGGALNPTTTPVATAAAGSAPGVKRAALTFDEFRKDTTGGQALQQQLQDRAEQLRQQLDSSGNTPAPAPAPASK